MTRNEHSIGRRLVRDLAIVYTLSLSLSITAFMMVAWNGGSLEADADQGRITDIVSDAIVRQQDGTLVLRETADLARFRTANPHFRVLVVDANTGAPAAGSSPELLSFAAGDLRHVDTAELDLPPPQPGLMPGILTSIVGPYGRVRMITLGARHQFYDVLHWVGAELETELFPMLVPLVLGSLGFAPWIVRRGLRPLARIEREAEAISPDNLGQRLDVASAPKEVRFLLTAINKALARVDDGYKVQRRFIANAAHELRTPLTILRARAEEISDPELANEFKKDLRTMAVLVEQMLSLARLQARQQELETLELVDLSRTVVGEMAPLAMASGADISLEATDRPVFVRGSAMGLSAALRNLVDNALRHAGRGGAVEISVEENGVVEVRDTGPGLPAADLERIFEPFHRGRNARGDGFGLGLAIAREVLEMHEGTITAHNDENGGGAVFRVALPVLAAA